jgi:hypothetical protein
LSGRILMKKLTIKAVLSYLLEWEDNDLTVDEEAVLKPSPMLVRTGTGILMWRYKRYRGKLYVLFHDRDRHFYSDGLIIIIKGRIPFLKGLQYNIKES